MLFLPSLQLWLEEREKLMKKNVYGVSIIILFNDINMPNIKSFDAFQYMEMENLKIDMIKSYPFRKDSFTYKIQL